MKCDRESVVIGVAVRSALLRTSSADLDTLVARCSSVLIKRPIKYYLCHCDCVCATGFTKETFASQGVATFGIALDWAYDRSFSSLACVDIGEKLWVRG